MAMIVSPMPDVTERMRILFPSGRFIANSPPEYKLHRTFAIDETALVFCPESIDWAMMNWLITQSRV
jgi:hypothetical protein